MTRALIVDDNTENQYLLQALLKGNGMVVEAARHGAEALERARAAPPDLVITDLLMPVMDGYSLLRHWKADDRLRNVPFIVYTATYTEPNDEKLAVDLGADAFLVKPAEPEPILQCIREVLARSRSSASAPIAGPSLSDTEILQSYNEVLVRKLEKRAAQLEAANQALHQEIAERRCVEEELSLRSRAIEAATQGIVIADPGQPGNPLVYVNSAFEQMTGYRAMEVLGRSWEFLHGRDSDPAAVAQVRHAVAAGEPCAVEILNYRKDGSHFWNQFSISPVRDAQDRLTHFVAVLADVTARRKLEEQLRQAQKMEAIGQLAAGVAHDFNNLLTVINGYSELIGQGLPVNHPTRILAGEIQRAGERSAALTRQLLAFSRKQVLAPRVLDLNGVVADTEKLLCRLIGEDIRLATSLGQELWAVRVDPGQMEQVLLNLVVNARDAMPRGGQLTIQTQNVLLDEEYAAAHPDARSGPHVLLSVTDSGCGMTLEVQAHVFEPFFTTKGIGKGTGLGLATVYGIVKQSGGHIAVYSEVGVGTTFKVYLPRADQAHPERRSRPLGESPPRGTETILLVEDEDAVRALAGRILTDLGYQVLACGNANAAMDFARTHPGPIHLLLTDVVMPGGGGRTVAEQIREQHPETRTLFMSGYTDDAVIRHGVLREGVHFLQKPFTPGVLGSKVREVLESNV